MKNSLILGLISLLLFACGEESQVIVVQEATPVEATLCNCLDSLSTVNRATCDSLFPEPQSNSEKRMRIDGAKICGIDLIYDMDTIVSLDSLPEPESIEEVLTMEVPDPLSAECQEFLENFAEAIKRYTKVVDRASANPDDFMSIIELNEAKSSFKDWPSKPQMFSCSDNESFKHKVEKLTEQADELLAS